MVADPRSLDSFHGQDRLRRLSIRLMDWYEDPVADADVVDALGPLALGAFRYAQQRLAGKVRRVTLEPSFCHSADVALRTRELGFAGPMVVVALLHDVVEDSSKTIADAPLVIAELRDRFGAGTALAVTRITNRYQLIFEALPRKAGVLPFERRGLRAYRAALEVLRHELAPAVSERFAAEIDTLGGFLDGDEIDLAFGERIGRRDRKFTLATLVGRAVYRLYVAELVRAAAGEGGEGLAPDTPLVLKYLDMTDNIRTTELSNRLALFKLLAKTEALLDQTWRELLGPDATGALPARSVVPKLHELLTLRLVDQTEARRRAVAENFAETRFEGLVGFLAQQTERLADKYAVPREADQRVERIDALEQAVQRANQH